MAPTPDVPLTLVTVPAAARNPSTIRRHTARSTDFYYL
jgi:hypothetical protein